jgi:hypothetical protein
MPGRGPAWVPRARTWPQRRGQLDSGLPQSCLTMTLTRPLISSRIAGGCLSAWSCCDGHDHALHWAVTGYGNPLPPSSEPTIRERPTPIICKTRWSAIGCRCCADKPIRYACRAYHRQPTMMEQAAERPPSTKTHLAGEAVESAAGGIGLRREPSGPLRAGRG